MNRRTSRCIALSLGLLLSGLGAVAVATSYPDHHALQFLNVLAPYRTGRVVCVVCSVRETRTEYGGIVLQRKPLKSRSTWWSRFVPADHEHEWHSVGCWGSRPAWGYVAVSCTQIYEQDLFLWTLPRFRDQDLASAVAKRLLSLGPDDRWSEQADSSYLADVSALMQPRIRRWSTKALESNAYETWRNEHPLWHDLFPPRLSDLR